MRKGFLVLMIFAAGVFVSGCNMAPPQMEDEFELSETDTGSISGRTWVDADGDGLYSTEEDGLPNVWLTLITEEGEIVDRITTDSDGTYWFHEVEAGTYRINFDLPDGYRFTTRDAGNDDIDSDATQEGMDQGITDAFELSIFDDAWYAGYVQIPGSPVFDIEVEQPQCHDINAAEPVACQSAVRRFLVERDEDPNYTRFVAEYLNSYDATVSDVCIFFDTKSDSGPRIAGLDGADEGLCWNSLDRILVWVEIGQNGEWIVHDEPPASLAAMESSESSDSGGARVEFRVENDYLGINEGRVKLYIFEGFSTFFATDWLEFFFPAEGE